MEQSINTQNSVNRPRLTHPKTTISLDHFRDKDYPYHKIIEAFYRNLHLEENNPWVWNNLGEALQEQGLWDKAEISFRQAINSNTNYVDAWSNLSLTLIYLNRPKEGLEACHQGLKLDPSLPSVHNHLALGLLLQHQLSEAEAPCQQALTLAPDYPEALATLGIIRTLQKQRNEAETLFGEAIAIKPTFAEAYANRAEVRLQQNRLDEALSDIAQALSLKPWLGGAYGLKARILMAQQNRQEAINAAHCAKILANNPWSAETQASLGNELHAQGKLDEAIASYQRAIALDPHCAQILNNLGVVQQAQGKREDAIASYQKALAIDPNLAAVHYNLGRLYTDQAQWDKALRAYQNALALKPHYPTACKALGDFYLKQEKIDEALNAYQKALELKPDYLEAENNLATAYLAKDWYQKAQEAFHRVFLKKHGTPWGDQVPRFDPDHPLDIQMPNTKLTASPFKLIEQIDRLNYLLANQKIDPSFQGLVERYQSLLQEIESQPINPEQQFGIPLLRRQLEPFAGYYDKIIHYVDAPPLSGSTLNESLDYQAIEDNYLNAWMVYFDDFLTPDALTSLRQFCLESTIFFKNRTSGYVGSYMNDGCHCRLLYQIVADLKKQLPRVLGPLPLVNMWIYRYQSRGNGIKVHAGDGSVTLNFWFTPDEANLGPKDGGGLVIYKKDHPLDWDWHQFNFYKDDPKIQAQINELIRSAESVTIPYRCNRAVLFHSTLWHRSDPFHFREGFENRRMNGVMLFGHRGKESVLME